MRFYATQPHLLSLEKGTGKWKRGQSPLINEDDYKLFEQLLEETKKWWLSAIIYRLLRLLSRLFILSIIHTGCLLAVVLTKAGALHSNKTPRLKIFT